MPLSSHLPVKVRLNRSLFPTDLLTVRVTGRHVLQDAKLEFIYSNDLLKSNAGDGAEFRTLGPTDSLDIFIHGGRSSHLELPTLRLAYLQTVRKEAPLAVVLSWTGVNGNGDPGQLCVTWTHEDRMAGLRPRIAFGSDCEMLRQYISEPRQTVTGELLRLRRRVPKMTRRDVNERVRHERKGSVTAMDSEHLVRASAISILGFRGFREEATLRLAQPSGQAGSGLTIVVGANNTGKSTVWESFEAVARSLKSAISFSEGRRNRLSTENGIRIRLEGVDGSNYVVESRNVNTSETKTHWEPEKVDPPSVEIVSVPSRRQFQASFGKNMTSERDWMSTSPDYTRSRQTDQFSQFTGRLFDLHNDERKKAKFDALMTKVLGDEFNWTIDLADGQFGQSYYLKVTTGKGTNHTSEGLGDGIISLLFVLNALFDSEPRTLLVLDEPELSLHPQLVRRLGRVIADFAADRQIVVFTHSPVLISWNDIGAGAEIARVYKVDGSSHIAQAQRKTLDAMRKVRGGWHNPHALGSDANEALFLDDGVIVVEGQEDAALLPRAFELSGVGLTGTIFGWGSGGEGNVAKILALLSDLKFSRVAAVMDNNVPKTVEAMRESFPGYLITEIPAADIRDKPSSNNKAATIGLFDQQGKVMKNDLKNASREVFQSVAAYLSADDTTRSI